VPKKTRTAEGKNQALPEPGAPTLTKKTAKRERLRRVSTAKKSRKRGAPKDSSDQPAQISPSPQPNAAVVPQEPSDDAVRLLAYYISERRRRFALPGDAESDWLEAKRQLLAESRR
jgi:hypothetical protein